MASALHPQTILATKYAREPITDPFGFPLRLRTATKLGFKNPKWITAIEVTNEYPRRLLGGSRLQLVQRHLAMTCCFRSKFRSRGLPGLPRSLLAATIGASFAAAQDKAEGEPKQLSAQEKMNRRYPQAVRVGFLVGLPVLDEQGFDPRLYPRGGAHAFRRSCSWCRTAPGSAGRRPIGGARPSRCRSRRSRSWRARSRRSISRATISPRHRPIWRRARRLAADETIRIAVTRR